MARKNQCYPGAKFGRLTVIECVEILDSGTRRWKCQCDCGNSTIVDRRNLGIQTNSCGCLRPEAARKACGKPIREVVATQNYNGYRSGARARKLDWALTKEEFTDLIYAPCHYCGDEAGTVTKAGSARKTYPNNGVDRVNSQLGYILSNCVTACKRCNIAKQSMSVDEFLGWARKIADHQGF